MPTPASRARAPPPIPPRLLIRLAFGLRRTLQRLANALVPAQVILLERIAGAGATHLLASVARLGIADQLATGPQTAAELAGELGVKPEPLHRMLRALAAGGLFTLDPHSGRFANTRISEALRQGGFGSMAAFAQYFATRANLDAWADFDSILRSGGNSFERVHGCGQWEWFAAHPDEEALFARAMSSLTQLDARLLVRSYPFEALASVCDIAGGRGTFLAELLKAHPTLRGAVFDAAPVADLARAYLSEQGVASRAEVHGGSFFERVPAGHAAYLLKDVLHDWDDAQCETILHSVRRAAALGARLLICEVPVEPFEPAHPGALIDVQMLVVCSGGRQRSRAEFEELCQRTGFRLHRVWTTGAPICLFEAFAV